MAAGDLMVGDIGTNIDIIVSNSLGAIDISSASVKQMIFQKPDGSTLTKTATFKTDGTDGVLRYTIIAGDLDTAGNWRIQIRLVFPSGTWSSSFVTAEVLANT